MASDASSSSSEPSLPDPCDPASHKPTWRPTARWTVLRQRARLLDRLRQFFIARGYWEVETPLLSRDTCIDPWIDPVAVADPQVSQSQWYLQTSPEFHMKRLLAAGADALFEITRSFRGGESGARHNIEFTIAEWYRAGDTYHDQMALVEDLIRDLAGCDLPPDDERRVPSIDLPANPFPRLTYDEVARQALGTSLLDKSTADLSSIANSAEVAIPVSLPHSDRDGWLNLLLAERMEPWLAMQPACFLIDFPASQAALARVRPDQPPVAERFELYLSGLELCNGYQELTDAEELASRMTQNNQLRVAAGARSLPVHSRLIDAMRHGLPFCSGVALGFDRLAMWRLGLSDIRTVLAFPFDRA